jgi:hypothetical protein
MIFDTFRFWLRRMLGISDLIDDSRAIVSELQSIRQAIERLSRSIASSSMTPEQRRRLSGWAREEQSIYTIQQNTFGAEP